MSDSYHKALDKIVAIISGLKKDIANIGEDTVLQDEVGLTSLQVMELILEVEDEFDISFPMNQLLDIRTVRELAESIATVLDQ